MNGKPEAQKTRGTNPTGWTAANILAFAFVLTIIFWGLTAAYAYRARESAIRGWTAVDELTAKLDQTIKQSNAAKGFTDYRAAAKAEVSANAGVTETDTPISIAHKLTNHLYQSTMFSGPYIATMNDPLRYRLTIQKQTFNFCSSLTATLIWALDLFDIKARTVNFAAKSFFIQTEGDTHTVAEVMIGGKPVVFDPTFNTTYSCGADNLIDARAMVECVKKTGSVARNYIGKPRPGRSLEEYYIPLATLLYAIDANQGEKDGFYQYESPETGWVEREQARYRAQQSVTGATP